MTESIGFCLEQYRIQAKDLLKQSHSPDLEVLTRIRMNHPEGEALAASGPLRLADCQLVIAREQGYESWTKLKQDLLFRSAVAAIDSGDTSTLAELLDKNPGLIRYRCRRGGWYEQGYFMGAMLIHHVAGNPGRAPLPSNIRDVTRVLLDHGADPNIQTEGRSSTIGLLLTSKQASDAGVALPLIDLLRAAGARDDVTGPDVLSMPLLNAAPGTAAELVRRGVEMDIRHAAGIGNTTALESLLKRVSDPMLLEEALTFACIRGEEETARILLKHGAKGDVLVGPNGMTPRTALHEAANRGHMGIVRMLLDNGASAQVVEPRWGGTAIGWAKEGGHTDIVALLADHAANV